MTDARKLARIEAWAWILIYGGLFAVVLGIATGASQWVAAWSLIIVGGLAAAGGVVLIVVRASLPEPGAAGAQSPQINRKPEA